MITPRPGRLPLLALLGGSLLACLPLHAQEQTSADPKPAAAHTPVTQLNPFNVSALYAAVDIRFTLSGENLFDPLADPVKSAQVVAVEIRDVDDLPEIKVLDTLVSIDGVKLEGLTLPQIATLLDNARKKGIPTWELRTIPAKFIKFDGDWLIPILQLKR